MANRRENGEHNTLARKMHPQITRKFICFSLGFIQLFHSQIVVCRLSLHLLLAATQLDFHRTKIHKNMKALSESKLKSNPHFELGALPYMQAIFHSPGFNEILNREFHF
jgi:hypothetical protein